MEQLEVIQSKIYDIRGQKVMLDFDLAEMYGIENRVLKQAVRRNLKGSKVRTLCLNSRRTNFQDHKL